MINLRNALILAGTKLKTRKIRLMVTVIVSSLMFGLLAVGIIVFDGFTKSIERFSKEGLNDRFFVQATFTDTKTYSGVYDYIESHEGKLEAKRLAEQIVDNEAKRAKELGLEYDRKLELNSLIATEKGEAITDKNIDSLVVSNERLTKLLRRQFMEKQKGDPAMAINLDNLRRISAGYNPVDFIKIDSLVSYNGTHSLPNEKGQYPIDRETGSQIKMDGPLENSDQPSTINMINVVPEAISKAYRFSDVKWQPESGTVPIMVSFDTAQTMLGLRNLPQGATAKEALARQKEVNSRIKNYQFKQCYRNPLAMEQLMAAHSYNQIKDDKDAIKPKLIYSLPADNACAVATVLDDRRSAQEKRLQAAQDAFDVEFRNRDATPIAKEIVFEVIGVLPSSDYAFMNQGSLATNLIRVAIGSPFLQIIATDTELAQVLKQQKLETIFAEEVSDFSMFGLSSRFIVEFSDVASARRFVDERGCLNFGVDAQIDYIMSGATGVTTDPVQKCTAERPFYLSYVMNNRAALDDLVQIFARVLLVALAVAVAVATIIMAGTVGRMIADSRRETAVFRAIGFKRFDISRIYGLYTIIVCCLIMIVVIGLGLLGAGLIDHRLSNEMTAQAILAVNSSNESLKVSLIGFSPFYFGMLLGAILLVGLLAIILPLLRNLRRNPIKDMRDE